MFRNQNKKRNYHVEQCATLLSMDVPTTMGQAIVEGRGALTVKGITTKEVPVCLLKKKWYMHYASPNQKKLFVLVEIILIMQKV